MNTVVCVEVLIATILVWISLFGILELAINQLEKHAHKLAAYILILVPVAVFASTYEEFSSCVLL